MTSSEIQAKIEAIDDKDCGGGWAEKPMLEAQKAQTLAILEVALQVARLVER